ncbi:MAG: iron chaperone [Ginsengibacter sp.]
MEKKNFKNVEEYISVFPENVKPLLQQMREVIINAAPAAEEVISYQMPAYRYHGILVYFGGHKNHIGFYPTASGMEVFKNELSIYKRSKGAVQFPLDKPLPVALISKMVKFRIKENIQKAESKMLKEKGNNKAIRQ